ncbi:uncharacterized protein [Anoplolepis gracilipes]|uniref:uncharacterized protein n=1 Tax=Anoplolepis gracilipes TaxID=354296 RepID=UPI003B9E50D4
MFHPVPELTFSTQLFILLSLKLQKMKRIAFLVLALAINVIADDEERIQQMATIFEIDSPTIKTCLSEAETTIDEIDFEKWKEMKSDEEMDEETKESFTTHGRFLACLLEKLDMMKDSKLVLDKILEKLEKEPHGSTESKEVITECVNSLNENDSKTREERAFEFIICVSQIKTAKKR